METKSGGGAGKRAHERMCVVCGVCAGGSLKLLISLFYEITIRSDNIIGEIVAKADGEEWF